MIIISILSVLVFSIVLCTIEIPKILKEKHYRELYTFSVLLGLGAFFTIFIIFDEEVPNPSNFIAWIYSPLDSFMRSLIN